MSEHCDLCKDLNQRNFSSPDEETAVAHALAANDRLPVFQVGQAKRLRSWFAAKQADGSATVISVPKNPPSSIKNATAKLSSSPPCKHSSWVWEWL